MGLLGQGARSWREVRKDLVATLDRVDLSEMRFVIADRLTSQERGDREGAGGRVRPDAFPLPSLDLLQKLEAFFPEFCPVADDLAELHGPIVADDGIGVPVDVGERRV